MKKHRQTSEPHTRLINYPDLTQLEGDDNWNIEWEQQGMLFDNVMYNALHFLEREMSRCSTRS